MTRSALSVRFDPHLGVVCSTDRGEIVAFGLVTRGLLRMSEKLLNRSARKVGFPTVATLTSIAEAGCAAPNPIELAIEEVAEEAPDALPLDGLATGDPTAYEGLLARRHSATGFGPMTLVDLALLLMPSAGIRDFGWTTSGALWTSRSSPSAGARHPVDILVHAPNIDRLDPEFIWLFDPFAESLSKWSRDTAAVTAAVSNCYAAKAPAVILLRAHFGRTLMRYPAGTAHVWRDAGALLQTLHLRCVDLGLNSRILGLGGTFGETEADGSAFVGGLLVGSSVSTSAAGETSG